MHDARDLHTLVFVQLVLEHGADIAAGVEHEVLADEAARIGEAIRKLRVRGVQQQARRFGAIRRNDHGARFLETLALVAIKVGDTGGAPALVGTNLEHIALGANFAAAGCLGFRNHREESR